MLHFDILSFCVIYSLLDGQNYLTDFAHQVEKDGLFSTCQLKHKFLIKIVFRCIFFLGNQETRKATINLNFLCHKSALLVYIKCCSIK